MESKKVKVKVVKSGGQLCLSTQNNEILYNQSNVKILPNSSHFVTVSVDFRIHLEDFCTESFDEDKGELVATIKGNDIALALDRYKRMDGSNIMKEPQFPEDRIG